MNKKLLSALLLGALTVTSTGTLVSCKDYDDDIAHLQDQIDANNETLKQIEALIKSGSVITNVAEDGEGITFTLSNGETKTVKNGKDGVAGAAGKDADVWTINSDGYWCKNGVATEYKAIGEKGEKGDKGDQGDKGDKGDKGDTGASGTGVDGKYYVPNEKTGCFDIYQNGKFVEATTIKYTAQGALTAVVKDKKVTIYGLVDENGNTVDPYVLKMGADLKSLVFSPEEYYQGIEAIQVDAYEYNPVKLFTLDEKNPIHINGGVLVLPDGGKLADYQDVVATNVNSFVPTLSLGYYLNPSNALVETTTEDMDDKAKAAVLAKYGFIVNDVNYTRTNDILAENDIEVTSVVADRATKGLVYVNATVNENNQAIKSIANNSAVTVAALRYNDGDTIITSDFAALHRAVTNQFDIIYGVDRSNTSFAGYITDDAVKEAKNAYYYTYTFTTPYNEPFDFNATIRAAYNPNGEGMQPMSFRKQKAAGFEFQYELVPYCTGNETTSQNTKHVKSLENGVLTPNAQRTTIGRQALVRIKLVDTKHNNAIVSVGYATVHFTDAQAEVVDGGKFTCEEPYKLVCGTNNFTTYKLTWEQMESIFDKLGISKTEFQNSYRLDRRINAAGQYVAKQFKDMTSGSLVDTDFGSVNKTTTDIWQDETDVLVWTIGNNEAYEFAANKENVEKNVIVRFVPTSSAASKFNDVYVTLTWAPKSRLVEPKVAIADADKANSAWFKAEDAAQGFADLHAHVAEAKAGNSDTPFTIDVDASTFKNAKGEVIDNANTMVAEKLKAAGYEELAENFTIEYRFNDAVRNIMAGSAVNNKANYYAVTVTDGGEVLRTNKGTIVAEIDPATGVITYADNDIAKDILNYASHKSLKKGETFTAPVIMTIKGCAPAEDAIEVTGNTFDVKFLRPINLTDAKVEVTDADPSTHTKAVALTFTDWRDFTNKQVYTSSNKVTDLFHFYGVKSIEEDKARDITSNFGGSFAKLSANDFKVTYTGATFKATDAISDKDPDFGSITYTKLTTIAVHDFQIKVPVVVTYDWGKLYTEITINVKKTVNNAARK